MVDKQLVRKRFLKHQDTYHKNAIVQLKVADRLAALIHSNKPISSKSILEIGAGTGFLTKHLNTLKPIHFYINDIMFEAVESLIEQYEHSINYFGDIETLKPLPTCDIIASSSTFQWLQYPEEFFPQCVSSLNGDGLLAFSTFGTENCKEIKATTGIGLDYINTSEYKKLLTSDVDIIHQEEELHTLFFDTAKDVIRHLKKTGVNGVKNTRWTIKQLHDFEQRYEQIRTTKGLPLTYHSIIIIAKKKAL